MASSPAPLYFNLQPKSSFRGNDTLTCAHAHEPSICFNLDGVYNKKDWRNILAPTSHQTATHEMGHCFAGLRAWDADCETMAELLMAYADEKLGPKIGVTNRAGYRNMRYNEHFTTKKTIGQFSAGSEGPSVYRFYLFGLAAPDKAGWDAIGKAIRSVKNTGKNSWFNTEAARGFLDRIEYFSGKPGILRTLPDKGELLDKYFNVEVKDKSYLNLDPKTGLSKTGEKAPAAPATPRPATPAQPPRVTTPAQPPKLTVPVIEPPKKPAAPLGHSVDDNGRRRFTADPTKPN